MEKEKFYVREKYENNFRKFNKMNRAWLFQNYIGGYYPLENNKRNSNYIKPTNNNNYLNDIIIMNNNEGINNAYKEKNLGVFFEFNRKEKEIRKIKEKEQYRKDLLKQIKENERKKQNLKREIYEENKINELKNNEYLIYKKEQEEEFEKIKKLNKNRKLKNEFNLGNKRKFFKD